MKLRRVQTHGYLLGLAVLLWSVSAWASSESAAAAGQASGTSGSGLVWGFRVLASVTLLGALATIVMRNAVVSSLCLVGTLLGVGGIYLLLNATFLAAIQVLVYAGAIMVLFVFVVMSVGHREREEIGLFRALPTKVLGLAAVGVLVVGRLIAVLTSSEVARSAAVHDGFGTAPAIGRQLFGPHLLPFEALSLLLLVAIVGAVMVTRRHRTPPREGRR